MRTAACAAAVGVAALLAAPAAARDDRNDRSSYEEILVEPGQRRAVERALRWISEHRRPGGIWGKEEGTCVADTSLSVLALMAGGNTVCAGKPIEEKAAGKVTLRGPYAADVKAGLEYLSMLGIAAKAGKPDGYIEGDRKSRMHGHGFATLALAEACGNLSPPDIARIDAVVQGRRRSLSLGEQVRYSLERAVRLTERSQDADTGGWTYTPGESGHEGSMTVTQILALRAAMEAGVRVNGTVMDKAYDYIRKSQNLVMREQYGGFAYQLGQLERVSYGLTGAALTTFFGLGRYGGESGDRKVIDLALAYQDVHLTKALDPDESRWFYYNLFYGAQALYLSGDERRIREQWPRIRAAVMDRQQSDGSFRPVAPDLDSGTDEYSTAIACLTLQVPMESLPIFQRR